MQVPVKVIVEHLKNLHLDGLLPEVVLREQFSCGGVTTDKTLLVHHPGLDKIEPLDDEVGVMDLSLLIQVLNKGTSPEADDQVSVEFQEHRIVVEQRNRGKIRLVTPSTATISTAISDDNMEQVLNSFGDEYPVTPLSQDVLEGLGAFYSILKPEQIFLEVRKKKGASLWRLGQETQNVGEVPFAALKSKENHTLAFSGPHLMAIFGRMSDFTKSSIQLSGDDGMVALRSGDYTYILSPMVDEA